MVYCVARLWCLWYVIRLTRLKCAIAHCNYNGLTLSFSTSELIMGPCGAKVAVWRFLSYRPFYIPRHDTAFALVGGYI
ncbi:hypothetical protein F4818DRAFT_402011 [Hypoxylon cercidicola]|nr:hypothetical protein F4818DRAFT_402011 [Hypoxylon cercidicola]